MTADDVMREVFQQRAEHTRAYGVHPTRCYLGWEQWTALRHLVDSLRQGLSVEPPTVFGLRVHHVLEADHLHVC